MQLAVLAAFLGALSTVWYLNLISDTDDREWLAWRRVYTSDELQAKSYRRLVHKKGGFEKWADELGGNPFD